MIPRFGRLRHNVIIQYKAPASPSKNEVGEDEYVWANFLQCQASIITFARKPHESISARQIGIESDVQIKLRWIDGVNEQMRVLYGTIVYDIQLVDNIDERGRMLLLYCTRGVSLG